MKKLIIIIFMCFILCGCGKECIKWEIEGSNIPEDCSKYEGVFAKEECYERNENLKQTKECVEWK